METRLFQFKYLKIPPYVSYPAFTFKIYPPPPCAFMHSSSGTSSPSLDAYLALRNDPLCPLSQPSIPPLICTPELDYSKIIIRQTRDTFALRLYGQILDSSQISWDMNLKPDEVVHTFFLFSVPSMPLTMDRYLAIPYLHSTPSFFCVFQGMAFDPLNMVSWICVIRLNTFLTQYTKSILFCHSFLQIVCFPFKMFFSYFIFEFRFIYWDRIPYHP